MQNLEKANDKGCTNNKDVESSTFESYICSIHI